MQLYIQRKFPLCIFTVADESIQAVVKPPNEYIMRLIRNILFNKYLVFIYYSIFSGSIFNIHRIPKMAKYNTYNIHVKVSCDKCSNTF